MQNPHEQTHNTLLARIINNMEHLNESIVDMNKMIHQANKNNLDNEMLANMWESYVRNAEYNLQATGSRQENLNEGGDEPKTEEQGKRT
ncbi:DAD4 [Candida oxycetoniae]|uniref:DASH complex subunit DAD4 n=1 Tax=Candida oxycetoniae TaxID=497107 RepID=A0AAI9SZC0_9ASCO|nr:DAD4 [Candida oxycetoniae]KAI3405585.1 DAD4 [Candida oxycetoniae]